MTQRQPRAPTRNYCPAHPQDNRHRFARVRTKECKHDWQFQNLCVCGFLSSNEVFGIEPSQSGVKVISRPVGETLSLNDPNDVAILVDQLFDENLDWVRAIRVLLPELTIPEARALAEQAAVDPRVTLVIDSYVKDLSAGNPRRFALLMHHSWKAAKDSEEVGAVRATALNILKSAHVTEKSQQDTMQTIQIVGDGVAEDIRQGIAPDEPKVTKQGGTGWEN